jgi:hypothetical protein
MRRSRNITKDIMVGKKKFIKLNKRIYEGEKVEHCGENELEVTTS